MRNVSIIAILALAFASLTGGFASAGEEKATKQDLAELQAQLANLEAELNTPRKGKGACPGTSRIASSKSVKTPST